MRDRRTLAPRSLRSGEPCRRINITMLESQHDELVRRGVNVSGLIRDLLDTYLSESTITLEVDAETRELFDQVMAGQSDVAACLRGVLAELLDRKLRDLSALRDRLREPGG